ncbi:MAG: DNA polymerase III subunit gamma/tau [Desulfobacteraceae bacterium]|nr:DNA polymerase III subunit gamma/tau [Desulfobacteraceae bacterium]
MSYLVLARKYRPQTFDQVVEQEHVTRTLANAISSSRVAHAILFSGPRGTGKTTIARILAKAMNCEHGSAPIPCNECRSCTEITSGSAVDVFEIDGASNNGVDHIRDLRENVKYMPAHSKYKIYVIDEVHMLSTPAFNALLKTLEEPPAHIKFMFATTEPHKIPVTILSRCQRYDLRRVELSSISKHMESLCIKEGINMSRESLDIIARESGGSVRDSLSLLDQVMLCSEGEITPDKVLDILGVIDRKIIFDISAAILNGDIPELLDILDNIYDHGHSIKELYSEVVEHFRNLLVVKMGKKVSKLVDVPAHETGMMSEQVKNVSQAYLSWILDILFKEESVIKFSAQPKLALEMAFIRIFQAKPVLPVEKLIEKLDNLSKGIYEDSGEIELVRRPGSVAQKTAPQIPVPDNYEKKPGPQVNESKTTYSQPEQPNYEPGGVQLPQEPEPPVNVSFDPDDNPGSTWKKFIDVISGKYPALGANLGKCTLKELTEQSLEIEVNGNGFNINMIRKNIPNIKQTCHDFFGKDMEILTHVKENQKKENQEKKDKDRLKHEALSHPLVEAAVEIFSGKVTGVKILQ